MRYPIEKYKIIVHDTEVIAISTYAGKTVRGIAKCDPRAGFDVETGKKIAVARCAAKIAAKRKARAAKCIAYAQKQLDIARKFYEKMSAYYDDADSELDMAESELQMIIDEVR